jgi:hypothetical protein
VSFFDDEGDEPPTRAARPRRPAGPRTATTGTRARTATAPSDAQQLMVRRAVALGAGALVLILLVFGVKGCLDSRTKNSLKDYNREVAAIAQDSNDQVSKPLFDLLSNTSGSSIGLQQNINQVRVTADEDVKRARALSVPGDMRDAQYHLLLALTLRSEGVAKIAADLPNVSGNDKRAAVRRIAGLMRGFLASDVVYSQRVIPYIQEALDAHGIQGQTIAASQFLPDDSWLNPTTVGSRLGVAGADSGAGASRPASPGLHGHGLTDVKVGGVTLTPAPATNRVPASAATAFTVDFQNQGDNDEFDVTTKLAITGAGNPINVQKRVDQTTSRQPASAQIRLGTAPPIGVPVRVKVTVAAVPGEKKTDNNTQTYVVIFTR